MYVLPSLSRQNQRVQIVTTFLSLTAICKLDFGNHVKIVKRDIPNDGALLFFFEDAEQEYDWGSVAVTDAFYVASLSL